MTGQLHLHDVIYFNIIGRQASGDTTGQFCYKCMIFLIFWSLSVPGSSWQSREYFAPRRYGEVWERLFWVTKGQVFIVLPSDFLLKSVKWSSYSVNGQQNWSSNSRWLFIIDFQRYSK